MDIGEEFEKLPEIAEILSKNGGGYYKENTNSYHHCNFYYDKYLNGAWYAFQEKQKKIDAALSKIDALSWASESDIDEIKELLK